MIITGLSCRERPCDKIQYERKTNDPPSGKKNILSAACLPCSMQLRKVSYTTRLWKIRLAISREYRGLSGHSMGSEGNFTPELGPSRCKRSALAILFVGQRGHRPDLLDATHPASVPKRTMRTAETSMSTLSPLMIARPLRNSQRRI